MATSVKSASEILDITPMRLKQILKSHPDLEYFRGAENNGIIKIPNKTVRDLLRMRGKTIKRNRVVIKAIKGGVGGTSTTIQVALRVAEKGGKVLICDIDPESSSSSFLIPDGFDYENANTLLEVFKHDLKLEEAIYPSRFDGVYFIPSKGILRRADRLVMNENPKHLMSNKLNSIEHMGFDTIFMDLPPTFSTLPASCYLASNLVILPTDSSAFAIESLGLSIEDITAEAEKWETTPPEMKILMNRYNPSRLATKDAWQVVVEKYGAMVLPTRIRESADFQNAMNDGLSIFQAKCPHDVRSSIDELADLVAPIIPNEEVKVVQ